MTEWCQDDLDGVQVGYCREVPHGSHAELGGGQLLGGGLEGGGDRDHVLEDDEGRYLQGVTFLDSQTC